MVTAATRCLARILLRTESVVQLQTGDSFPLTIQGMEIIHCVAYGGWAPPSAVRDAQSILQSLQVAGWTCVTAAGLPAGAGMPEDGKSLGGDEVAPVIPPSNQATDGGGFPCILTVADPRSPSPRSVPIGSPLLRPPAPATEGSSGSTSTPQASSASQKVPPTQTPPTH